MPSNQGTYGSQTFRNSPLLCPPKDFWVLVGIAHVIARRSIMIDLYLQCPPYDSKFAHSQF
ncbi:MAG: hypothetical protein F6K26_30365 [Moorea sp. SIO2I5]|nr:hypothetical protein [Moorena sp. SIO2I5]